MMEDLQAAAAILTKLRSLGIHIAIDDFGTGYSSLSCVQQLPIETLKIDRSFVANLHAGPNEGCIIRAVIGMGKELGVRVVAEGVETEEQARYFRSHGCDVLQGYWLSPPLSGNELTPVLKSDLSHRLLVATAVEHLRNEAGHRNLGVSDRSLSGSAAPPTKSIPAHTTLAGAHKRD